ncbi:hypothetical protein TEA_010851 [Camellia sinensis var. sinensis]|uniref:Glycosyltransferase n=1 Tax=Camellia sinensis var. sinensis TaxID=542762 RepID=A0A4S4EPB6_CAMSN|nr:hypothetical protein TEA_010851 [Camellia sinensis var. sinensis]
MEAKQSTVSIFMFPWLAHGHISPYLELAKKLSTRNFKIYLCSTPVNLSSIKRKLSEKYSNSIQLIELHVPPFPDLPPPYHTTKDLPPHLMPTLKKAFDSAEPNFSLLLKAHKPDLLIYDFLQPWAPVVAAEYGIPAVDFITSSVTMTAFMHHLYKDPLITFPFPSIYLRDYDKVEVSHLLNPSKNLDKDKTRCFECLDRSSEIVLIKTFKEVEGKYIDYLSGLVGKKIVPVPLVQDCVDDNDDSGIIGWLEKKERRSTVFVCFGTEYFLSEDEIEEIAYGLEISGVNFVWVVRFPMGANTSVEKAMPRGFVERVGERGMVVEGWAPQVKILLHPSIGGFVSHCGWSSVMEGMKLGSPIIAIPMHLDQPVNARLVEEIGVGMEAVRDKNGVLDRKNVAEVIQKVVVDDSGETVRSKARELSETLSIKGEEDIDGVVEELMRLYSQKKRQDCEINHKDTTELREEKKQNNSNNEEEGNGYNAGVQSADHKVSNGHVSKADEYKMLMDLTDFPNLVALLAFEATQRNNGTKKKKKKKKKRKIEFKLPNNVTVKRRGEGEREREKKRTRRETRRRKNRDGGDGDGRDQWGEGLHLH